MNLAARSLAWGSAAVALIGFVQPWAYLDLRDPALGKLGSLTKRLGRVTIEVKHGAERVTGELPSLNSIPKHVSGIQIPQLANQDDANLAMAIMELLTNTSNNIGFKSYAVYLLPGLALLGAALLTLCSGSRFVPIGVAAISSAVAAFGFWKLLTTDTRTLFIAITIGRGLWMSLWAYVGLAAAAGLAIMPHHFRRVSSGSRAEA